VSDRSDRRPAALRGRADHVLGVAVGVGGVEPARLLPGAARPHPLALLDAAAADGAIRDDVDAEDLLYAVAQLCQPVPGRGPEHAGRIVGVLLDGLRCGAGQGRPHYPAAR
jgi:hypothetical protein